MFELFPPSEQLTTWTNPIIQASGWKDSERLLLWWGATPSDTESGSTDWSGDPRPAIQKDPRWTHGGSAWDVIIELSERTTDLFATRPGFVAWILGHELGHARLAMTDPDTHRLSLFVQERIKCASGGEIKDMWQLPVETACDRFGRYVAEAAVGSKLVSGDLSALTGLATAPMGAVRLKMTLDQEPIAEMPDLSGALRDLVRPYGEAVLKAWADEVTLGETSLVFGLDPALLLGD